MPPLGRFAIASLGHVALGLAAGRCHTPLERSRGELAAAMLGYSLLSLAPDIDIIAFALGVPYSAPFGHRGATHSLSVAAMVGLGLCVIARWLGASGWPRTGLLAGAVVASHGLLDTLTDGGLGIALLWPLSDARYFAPWRPLPVAPIGANFVSLRGLRVALTELAWFAPVFVWALWPRGIRRG